MFESSRVEAMRKSVQIKTDQTTLSRFDYLMITYLVFTSFGESHRITFTSYTDKIREAKRREEESFRLDARREREREENERRMLLIAPII